MPDKEKVEKGLNICTSTEPCNGCPYLNERNCSLAMVADALSLLKEQDETISNLNETVKNLLQQIIEIKEYMTPIGKVKDVKAYDAMMNEQETELCDRCGWVRLKSSRISESR